MTHVAQVYARNNILAFIWRDPTSMAVQNRKTVITSSGGKKYVNDGETFQETVRMVPSASTSEQQPNRVTADGRTVLPNWMVVALPETEIKVGTILVSATGDRFEVVHQARVPSWRVTFEAIQDGY